MTGFVSLVGAGPGSAELLTLKAVRRLAEADLVLYDGLVDPEALTFAPRAHRFLVGKRVGPKGIQQSAIHRLMIHAAKKGQRVVRLKGGDPFVFGRGGEEALALAQAGIPFEVVPGISSAIAGPALCGIPVTHRGLTSGFLVVSGHDESAFRPILASVAPNSLTVVILMGMGNREKLAQLMLTQGWRPNTPAAIAWDASRPTARTWIGDLANLSRALDSARAERGPTRAERGPFTPSEVEGPSAPGTICVGEVVSLASQIGPAVAEFGGPLEDELAVSS